MVELIGYRSSGRFSIVLATLAAVTTTGESAALVDLGHHFDSQAAAAANVTLERLLWVSPNHLKKALASTEILLNGGFSLVILDLGNPPIAGGRGVEASWLRLARAAVRQDAALLISSPYRISGSGATIVVKAKQARPRWRGRGRTPRLLHAVSAELTLEKAQRHANRRSATLEFAPKTLLPPSTPISQTSSSTATKTEGSLSTHLSIVRP